MPKIRHKVCPNCKRVCALTNVVCATCHTSLVHAHIIDVPVTAIRDDAPALSGQQLVVIPPVKDRVDDDYLSLFRRPQPNVHGEVHPIARPTVRVLMRQASFYQFLGVVAFISALACLGVACVLTISLWRNWQLAWAPAVHTWPMLASVGFLMTALQLLATLTAFRARDYARILAECARE